jgi:hypothetical protein
MNEAELEHEYPGVGRLYYFLGNIGMIASAIFVVTVFGPNSTVMKVFGLVVMVASLVLDVLRLRNMGVSDWFAFIRFLPFGKTVLWVALMSAQTGWAETRQLDSAGKSILLFQLVLFGLLIFMFFWLRMSVAAYSGFQLFGSPIS